MLYKVWTLNFERLILKGHFALFYIPKITFKTIKWELRRTNWALWIIKYKLLSMNYDIWTMKVMYEHRTVNCELCLNCEMRTLKTELWSVKYDQ